MSLKIIVNIFYEPKAYIQTLLEADDGAVYYPINGGASLKSKAETYNWLHFDDEGTNQISKHNHLFNEMTSIYWFWKNYDLSTIDYVGFNHYRRIFNFRDFHDYRDYDVLVGRSVQFPKDVRTHYKQCHNEADLNCLSDILTNDNLGDEFNEYLGQREFFAPCNMFIMKTELFKEYCNFMFPTLFKLEVCVNIQKRTAYQQRAIAFLSERLTSFWMWMHMQSGKKSFKTLPIQFLR